MQKKGEKKNNSKHALALIGREEELRRLKVCLQTERNVLLEGPVGVGKTFLALATAQTLKRPVFRVDGDSRYTEQKLTGWFDPPTVLKKGYTRESFIPGPLVQAMLEGGILFINELNRLPEGVQNVLLPAIDEKLISVPRLGEIRAKPGFQVLATQNPKEFVATSHLSEALLDRFELVVIHYQSFEEEVAIVNQKKFKDGRTGAYAVSLVRSTRSHPKIRRGASVRAAISIAELTHALQGEGLEFDEAFITAAILALPTRIEVERTSDASSQRIAEELAQELAKNVLNEGPQTLKKKSLHPENRENEKRLY